MCLKWEVSVYVDFGYWSLFFAVWSTWKIVVLLFRGKFLHSLQALVELAPKYILEQFMEAELMVNITEHEVGD